MIYLLAIVFPPIAVLLKGKPIQACLNFLLWCCFILPGILHAILVINKANEDKRHKEMIEAIKNKEAEKEELKEVIEIKKEAEIN